ncbi:ABC transporter, ATP-binding protein [Teladorsagia circumcincta]|uniref:ABC transporter, ATP-binding protein n=1 Tax=Teladorsagia circumcincta TaxID=45464 RepID=A0A2G9UW67_TELCI|nr:ABC transporter, ATP-binding protein [Teladorsagia circumcincta]
MGLLIRGFAMFFSSIIACCAINWQITLISLTMGPIAAMTMAMLGKVNSVSLGRAMKLQTEAASVAEESVMNVKTVQSCNGQEHMVKKYRTALGRALPYSIRGHFWMGFFEGLSFFQIYVVIGIALWFGCYGFFNGFVADRGDVLLCVSTISLTAYYLGMLGPHMMALLKARVAAAAIYETIDRLPTTGFQKDGLKKEVGAGHIVLKDVHFSYSTRKQSVLNVSLLTRLYEVSDGKITIDGVPLCDYDVESLRKRIGIVQQEPYLFNGTVKENISLGRDGIDDEKIRQAADTANVTEFVNRLEKGFDTYLGAGGVTLSGGQKQRIAIARAVAADPRILFLDEATSALDANSEKVVQVALNKAAKGRTTVIIAHRLSTIRDVKKIYVMEKGKVVETGSHDELMEEGGIYAKLATAQQFQNGPSDRSSEQLEKDSKSEPLPQWLPVAPKRSRAGPLPAAYVPVSGLLPSSSFDSDTSGGLGLLYRNMKGSRLLAIGCLFVAATRALELPGLGLAYLFAFKSLQMDETTYQNTAFYAFLISCICGGVIWFAQCTSSAIEIIEQARSIKLAVVEKQFLRKYAEQRQASIRHDFWVSSYDFG